MNERLNTLQAALFEHVRLQELRAKRDAGKRYRYIQLIYAERRLRILKQQLRVLYA